MWFKRNQRVVKLRGTTGLHMDIVAMVHKVEGPKPNPKNAEKSYLYSVTLRSLGTDKKVTESPVTLWFNPKLKNRFEWLESSFPVAVALLGVYVQPGRQSGEVAMSLSDNGRISRAKTSVVEALEQDQGACFQ